MIWASQEVTFDYRYFKKKNNFTSHFENNFIAQFIEVFAWTMATFYWIFERKYLI